MKVIPFLHRCWTIVGAGAGWLAIQRVIAQKWVPFGINILDVYVHRKPSHQNILDLFAGEWSSTMPVDTGLVATPGNARLFEDDRIKWAEKIFGGFKGLSVLELGPLEGGHSRMLQVMGADKVVAIEANTRAFLKCLCIKEIFKLDRVEFKLGDFILYLRNVRIKYDVVLASGVLYHMQDPIETLDLISSVTDKIFLWTHYYDKELLDSRGDIRSKFGSIETSTYKDFKYNSVKYHYQGALKWQGFCGGSESTSIWLFRNSITSYLDRLGFEIQIDFDCPNHLNGPSFAICAVRHREVA